MPVYQPRAERLDLSFPVIFAGDGDTLRGSCRNISLSGLSASFARPPELWIVGTLTLQTGRTAVLLKARVARVLDREAGFAFILSTEADQNAVHALVAFAASNTQLTGDRPPF